MRRLTSILATLIVTLGLGGWLTPTPAVEAATRQTITSLTIAPTSVISGRTATMSGQVRLRRTTTVAVEAAIRTSDGSLVWSQRWANQAFNPGQSQSYQASWAVPPGQAPGSYSLSLRLFDGGGAMLASRKLSFNLRAASPLDMTELDTEEAEFLRLLNDYRQAHGRPALTLNQNLTTAAVWQSYDMGSKRYVSHTDSLGRDAFQRMAAFGYTANTWKGENIAAGYPTAAAAFAAWQGSAGHNANMLNANYRVIGIGRVEVAGSPYGVYWTTDFGGL
jgi:uncharacterized protein YkwD